MIDTKVCQFCEDIDVIHVNDDQVQEDSLLTESVAYLVRHEYNSKPYIVINVDQADRDLQDNDIGSHQLDDYLTFIEAHETVHFLEDHLEESDDNEFKADLYGTALCVLKGHPLAADIGCQRLDERYSLEDSVGNYVRNAISDLQS